MLGVNVATGPVGRQPQRQRKAQMSCDSVRSNSRYSDSPGKKAPLEVTKLISEAHAGRYARTEPSVSSKKLMAAHALLAVGTPPASPPMLSPSMRCGSADSHASSTTSSDHRHPMGVAALKDAVLGGCSSARSRSRSPLGTSETSVAAESKTSMSQDRYSNYDRHFKKKFFGKDPCWKNQTPQQRAIMEEKLGKFRNSSPLAAQFMLAKSPSALSTTSKSPYQVTAGASHLSAFRPAVASRFTATRGDCVSPRTIMTSLQPNPFLKLGLDGKGSLLPPGARAPHPAMLCNGLPTLDLNGYSQPLFSGDGAPSFSLPSRRTGVPTTASSSTPPAGLRSDGPRPAGPPSFDPPIFGSVARHGE